MRRLIVFIVSLVLLAGCITQTGGNQPSGNVSQNPQPLPTINSTPGQPANTSSTSHELNGAHGISITEGPDFICNIFDEKANALGIGGADLGVPLLNGSNIWLIFGDTASGSATALKRPIGPWGSSSVIESSTPFSCSGSYWDTQGNIYYQPIISSRTPEVDESTVPAGGIVLDGTRYLYSMRVDHWSKNTSESTHAHGILFKQEGDGPFVEVAQWPEDKPFVNSAPVSGSLPNGTAAIFFAATGLYRQSPIYMAYVIPSEIENSSDYNYLAGYGQNGTPIWTSDPDQAKPLQGFEDAKAGELSLQYDEPLKTYLLMFKNYQPKNPEFELSSSSTPYGPFSAPTSFFPCGSEGASKFVPRPEWMEPGWGGCYGGYILPADFGPDGHDLYFTLSVWTPYTTMLVKMRLNDTSG